jgi:hypothetical protein
MKKLLISALLLIVSGCHKDYIFHNREIIQTSQSMGNAVTGPFRIDSLADASDGRYWVTSNNGVDVDMETYWCEPTGKNYSWVGPSKYVPDAYTNGNTINPRTTDNNGTPIKSQ